MIMPELVEASVNDIKLSAFVQKQRQKLTDLSDELHGAINEGQK